MADPISIAGMIITAGQILSTLYDYGKGVKEARKDIQQLSLELFALKGILEYIDNQHDPSGPNIGLALDDQLLLSADEELVSLLRKLERPISAFKKAIQSLRWPLDQGEVAKYADRLERIKSTLLLIYVTGNAVSTQETYDAVLKLGLRFDNDAKVREERNIREDNAKLWSWLAPVSTKGVHTRICQGHRGTRKWFIEGLFVPWASGSEQRMLCVIGKSGSGKTTLFSLTVQRLEEICRYETDSGFAYFYCSFNDTLTQEPVAILGSIAAQLAERDASLSDQLRPVYERNRGPNRDQRIDLAELEQILCQHFLSMGNCYILVDAINESQYAAEIVECLCRMMRQAKNLRVFFTATASLETQVPDDLMNIIRTIHLQSSTNSNDIGALVEHALVADRRLSRLDTDLKRTIRDSLIQGAHGSFRWVHLSLMHLKNQRTGRAVTQALNRLPETLKDIYASIFARIPKDEWEIARRAMIWLSFSTRPMTLSELNEAVVLEGFESVIDKNSRFHQEDALLEICDGLVEITAGHASLAHSSVKAFLTSEWILTSEVAFFAIQIDQGHRTLMHKCLQYLCLDHFRQGYCDTPDEFKTRVAEYPLITYASIHWADHARLVGEFWREDQQAITRLLATRVLPRSGNYGSWIQNLIPDRDVSAIEEAQPLYYAASYGLVPLITAILTNASDVDVNACGGRWASTPLFVSCWRGHWDVARLLLRAGGDPWICDASGYNVWEYLDDFSSTVPEAKKLLEEIEDSSNPLLDSRLRVSAESATEP